MNSQMIVHILMNGWCKKTPCIQDTLSSRVARAKVSCIQEDTLKRKGHILTDEEFIEYVVKGKKTPMKLYARYLCSRDAHGI